MYIYMLPYCLLILNAHISFYAPLKDMQSKNKNESSGNIFKINIVVRTKRKQLSLKIV